MRRINKSNLHVQPHTAQQRKLIKESHVSRKNKFKQLMMFDTANDLEEIEYEMLVLDKLLKTKQVMTK